jgi:hypothetical protein
MCVYTKNYEDGEKEKRAVQWMCILTHTSRRERWRIFSVPRCLPLHATIKVLYCHKIGWKLWAGCATVASRQGRAFLIWASCAIVFFFLGESGNRFVGRGKYQGLRIWCWKHERLHNTENHWSESDKVVNVLLNENCCEVKRLVSRITVIESWQIRERRNCNDGCVCWQITD